MTITTPAQLAVDVAEAGIVDIVEGATEVGAGGAMEEMSEAIEERASET